MINLIRMVLNKLIFLLLVSASSLQAYDFEHIDCNGKAFHCKNSTSFFICVDMKNGTFQTVDDFAQTCPPGTFCNNNARFECMSDAEYNDQMPYDSDMSMPVTTHSNSPNTKIIDDESSLMRDGDNIIGGINALPVEEYPGNGIYRNVNPSLLTTYAGETNDPITSNIKTYDDSGINLESEMKPPMINVLNTNFTEMRDMPNLPQNIRTLNYIPSNVPQDGMFSSADEMSPNPHEPSTEDDYVKPDYVIENNEGNRLPNSIDSLASFTNSNLYQPTNINMDKNPSKDFINNPIPSMPIHDDEPTTEDTISIVYPNQNSIIGSSNVISTLSGIPSPNIDSQYSNHLSFPVRASENSTMSSPENAIAPDSPNTGFPINSPGSHVGSMQYIPPIYIGTTTSTRDEDGTESNDDVDRNNNTTLGEKDSRTGLTNDAMNFQPVAFVPSPMININSEEENLKYNPAMRVLPESDNMSYVVYNNNTGFTYPHTTSEDVIHHNISVIPDESYENNKLKDTNLNKTSNLSEEAAPILLNSDFVFPDDHVFESMTSDINLSPQSVNRNYELIKNPVSENNQIPNSVDGDNIPFSIHNESFDRINPIHSWFMTDPEDLSHVEDTQLGSHIQSLIKTQNEKQPHVNNEYSNDGNSTSIITPTYNVSLPDGHNSTVENKVLWKEIEDKPNINQSIPINYDLNKYQGYGYSLNQIPEGDTRVKSPEQINPGSGVVECHIYETIPDFTTCHSYFVCRDNQQHRLFCPYNMVFSPILKICTTDKDHCMIKRDFKCTSSGMYPDPTSCYSYYECQLTLNGFKVNKYFCPWYSSYNPQYKQCVEGDSHCRTLINNSYRTYYYPSLSHGDNVIVQNEHTQQPSNVIQRVEDKNTQQPTWTNQHEQDNIQQPTQVTGEPTRVHQPVEDNIQQPTWGNQHEQENIQQPTWVNQHGDDNTRQPTWVNQHEQDNILQPTWGNQHADGNIQQPTWENQHGDDNIRQPTWVNQHEQDNIRQPTWVNQHVEDIQQPTQVTGELTRVHQPVEDNIQQPTWGNQHADDNTRQPTWVNQHEQDNIRQTTWANQHGEDSLRQSTWANQQREDNIRQPTWANQHGEDNTRQPAWANQHGEDSLRQSTWANQQGEDNIRQPTWANQHGEDNTRQPTWANQQGEDNAQQPTRPINIQHTISRPYEGSQNVNNQPTQGQLGTPWIPSDMYWS